MIESLFEFFGKYWGFIGSVISVFCALLMAWFSTHFTPRIEHDKVVQKVAEIDKRLSETEMQLEYMPTRDELHALDKTLEGLGARFGAMEQGIRRLETKTDMLLENELSQIPKGGH
ncbi:DUF2730 domain-containing protein [Shewanella seohaensis]|uniref:DUF2730 domain-containing protein n=1 Tax=Shewanella seohaensis TaxID=755175 RepID=UPI00200E82EC|nr:DUF2730 domain-containing protein [Shewanella seohaensis]MCL1121197.1 DUF2730 domain-containing protein [Shewanella seohaensis]UXM80696.1 DUF2730 domain-containing protein [Shewanella seohaensis]